MNNNCEIYQINLIVSEHRRFLNHNLNLRCSVLIPSSILSEIHRIHPLQHSTFAFDCIRVWVGGEVVKRSTNTCSASRFSPGRRFFQNPPYGHVNLAGLLKVWPSPRTNGVKIMRSIIEKASTALVAHRRCRRRQYIPSSNIHHLASTGVSREGFIFFSFHGW